MWKTPQEALQLSENEALKKWAYLDTNETDDHYTHMITCDRTTIEWEAHWQSHYIKYTLLSQPTQPTQLPPQGGQIVNQAMAQIGNEQTSLNSNQ